MSRDAITGEHLTATAGHTEELAEELAARLAAGDLILLEGELAAGKTTFVRGLVRGLGGDADEVSSPTFVLVQSYPCVGPAIRVVHHVDLYRLDDNAAALREIGIEELLSDETAVTAVEWPRPILTSWLPAAARRWRVSLSHGDGDQRRIRIDLV